MGWVRGQERYVADAVYDHIKARMMVDLGWDGALLGRLPFDAQMPLSITDMPPDPRTNVDAIRPNAIAISEGDIPDDDDLEMGAGLLETRHTVFVDIFGEKLGITKALAADVRSIMVGRVPGYSRYINFTELGAGHALYFDEVFVEFPEVVTQYNWAVVKATAVHEWNP